MAGTGKSVPQNKLAIRENITYVHQTKPVNKVLQAENPIFIKLQKCIYIVDKFSYFLFKALLGNSNYLANC